MKQIFAFASMLMLVLSMGSCCKNAQTEAIPLPEHPRPDFERTEFINLNGHWHFTFAVDQAQASVEASNFDGFDQSILVPFPWGSKLSEVEDKADIAYYGRQINVPASWEGKRVFLVVGASDWETTAWIDGKELGKHQGGYTPFEFELTDKVTFGQNQNIYVKVDDTMPETQCHLYGKQGYGNARGIWQTVYLEARGQEFIDKIYFTPDIKAQKVNVKVELDKAAPAGTEVEIAFKNNEREAVKAAFDGGKEVCFDVELPNQHLWDIDDPYLYDVVATVKEGDNAVDAVSTYFGQREIGSIQMDGGYKYVSLNGKPLYLKLCLDQCYHPDGFYTYPSDEFMKNEIQLSKNIGLNGNRLHIKVEVPRKLYWADKLGLLIMADVPNFWGEPIPEARQDWENCMRAQVARDFNHPAIFAWVDFNETWGLFTKTGEKKKEYLPETQEWVRSMWKLTKSLDPTRIVEDNSACNNDHVETDINSWHSYLPNYEWEKCAALYDKNTFPGGTFNYIGGNKINDVPMINSECGNVWGYEGSAGDCDYTFDYHEMMNAFHRHPKIAGWLYTEHHDVINEWNGYVKFDRTAKIDGLDELVPDMKINDFHSDYYIVPEAKICNVVPAGSTQTVKLSSSFTTCKDPGELTLETELVGWNTLGELNSFGTESDKVAFKPFCLAPVAEKKVVLPAENGVYVYRYVLKNDKNEALSRNFSMFIVKDGKQATVEGATLVSFAPASFSAAQWTGGNKDVLGGLKVNGFGNGSFEYTVTLPETLKLDEVKSAELLLEASSKIKFGKDFDDSKISDDLSYMLGGGTFDPCRSANSYAMTDTYTWPSQLVVKVNGVDAGTVELADDPADHRGILSWAAQPTNRYMFEAGSYGYLLKLNLPVEALKKAQPVVITLSVPETADKGLAIYGKDFGRYPLDPTIIIK